MFTIKSESHISNKGKREVNEDNIKYQSGKFYIVCDGLGGNDNGRIASNLLAETINKSLSKSDNIIKAVKDAEKVLEAYKKKNPTTIKMASTLAVVQILDKGLLITWAGDSRVYQFRDGKITYKTKDHTLVGEAIDKGVLTVEEALFHPDANVLTKSIKGSKKPVELDQYLIEDIKENDYFLLCTDGVNESWIDSDLEELFSESKSSQFITDELEKGCKIFSSDNYTAIIFQL